MKKLVFTGIFLIVLLCTSFVIAAPKGWIERRVSSADPVRWDPSLRTSIFKDSDGLYHVVWEYLREWRINFDLIHATLGSTISITEITPRQFESQTDPQIAVMPGFFYVVFTDSKNRHNQISLQKVRNDGTTLLRDPQVVSSNNPELSGAQSPSVERDGNNNLYVVWSDNRNSNSDLYFSKLDPSGVPYPSLNNKRLTTSPSNSYGPSLTLNSDNTFNVVWQDDRGGNPELYVAKFTSNGDPATPERRITSGSYPFYWDPVSALGPDGMVYIAWGEIFVPPGIPRPIGSYGIFLEKVNPSTGEAVIPRTMISAPLPDMPISVPSLGVDSDGYAHVSFSQGYGRDRYTLFYRKHKATIRPTPFEVVASVSLTSDNAISDFPSMVFDGQDAHIAFVNNRNDIDGEVFVIHSEALIEFENLHPGQTGVMKVTNTLWPNTQAQAALSSATTPQIRLPDGRLVNLAPDPLFFLSLSFLLGRFDEYGQATFRVPVDITVPAGLRFYAAAVAYSATEPMPEGIKHISRSYEGVIT